MNLDRLKIFFQTPNMDNAIVVNDTGLGTTVGLLFEVGNVNGLGVVLGLGIVALACILAKCLFLYYIKFHAPKERPLNKLLALEQVSQAKYISQIQIQFECWIDNYQTLFQVLTLLVLTPLFFMTIGKVSMPSLFHENIGTKGCQIWTTMWVVQITLLITCGFMMALYRLLCLKGKRFEVKYFIAATLALESLSLTTFYSAINEIGWETSPAYRYCIDYQPTERKIPVQNLEKGLNMKMLMNRSTMLALTISEFGMYAYMILYLWKWDERNHQKKIITNGMLKARKEKNALTLKGQICTFITKVSLVMSALIVLISGKLFVDEKSATPFVVIIPYSIISFSQILSSHELRRYVKSKFD